MIALSNIFAVPPAATNPGVCSICGQTVFIRFKDNATGQQYGGCCISFALSAEQILSSSFSKGVRHPNLAELENHEFPNN